MQGWHGDADHLDEIGSDKNVVDVKLEATIPANAGKDKNTVKMAVSIPTLSTLAAHPVS